MPALDPRREAASLGSQLSAAKSRLQKEFSTAAQLAPIQMTESASDSDHNANDKLPRLSTEEKQARVSDILAGYITLDAVDELHMYLYPSVDSLPRNVSIADSALVAWLEVRSQWTIPLGDDEIHQISRRIGLPQEFVQHFDPQVPAHVHTIRQAMDTGHIDPEVALAFYERQRQSLKTQSQTQGFDFGSVDFGRAHLPTYQGIVHFVKQNSNWLDDASRELVYQQWARPRGLMPKMDSQAISLVSILNTPTLWGDAVRFAARPTTSVEMLQMLHAAAIWHFSRNDMNSLPVVRRLQLNDRIASSEFVLDIDASDSAARNNDREQLLNPVSSPGLPSSQELVTRWIATLTLMSSAERSNFYRHLLRVPPPEPETEDSQQDASRRAAVLALTASGLAEDPVTHSLAVVLFCRWATPQQESALLHHARIYDREGSTVVDPDATGEAITRLCLLRSLSLGDAAKFWLHQAAWPRGCWDAWIGGGEYAERAFCEAMMRTDFVKMPAGFDEVLRLLGDIGGTATLTVLDGVELSLDPTTHSNMSQLIDSAQNKIANRISGAGGK
ncbi:hypothetical protein Poly21_09450 [Allorhodopirellula heiligendammensis]|uniref:Uncharacterized protein n=2 Tax=Allorhodopirellula heiligendammensis TaxID=2714739 RepID=A0A5C6C7Q8_9BACT|nr:hypothetical protein Poly21_09450 [Allorhodopirellula heiligendammensis]